MLDNTVPLGVSVWSRTEAAGVAWGLRVLDSEAAFTLLRMKRPGLQTEAERAPAACSRLWFAPDSPCCRKAMNLLGAGATPQSLDREGQ